MKSGIIKTFGALLIGLFIFVLTLHLVGIGKIVENLLKLNIYLYLVAIGCIACVIVFWTLRWQVFIKADGYDISFLKLLKSLLVGLAINNLTPLAKFGGEPLRAYILKKKSGIKMREGFATVLAELTIMFLSIILLVVTSMFLITLVISPPPWIVFILISFGVLASLGFLGIIGVYSGKDVIEKIIRWVGGKVERLRPYQEKILKRYKDFQETFRKCLQDKRSLAKASIYSMLGMVFNFLKFFFIFSAVGYAIDPLKIIIAMGIAMTLLSLPVTPGSLGVYEGGFISALAFLGVPAQIAATVVFLERLIWFWGVTLIGGSLGTYYGVNIIEAKKRTS